MITVLNRRVSLYLSVAASVVAFVAGTAVSILVVSSSGIAHFTQADAATYAASAAAAGTRRWTGQRSGRSGP